MIALDAIALAGAVTWVILLSGRGGFWRSNVVDSASLPDPVAWPGIVALVPARDEASVIGKTLQALAAQDYPGAFRIIVIDDHSSDGTAICAAAAAGRARLDVISGLPLPPGWTGKLWALQQGIDAAESRCGPETYFWLIDADIATATDTLRSLVQRAEAGSLTAVSLMAKLDCSSRPGRWLIPAFVFFFQMLFPFRWVNTAANRTAAAAGGCLLVQRDAMAAIGGLGAMRGALIDDCALGGLLKRQGPVWLGLTNRATSLRASGSFGDIRRMVSRSAYAQLDFSPFLLVATVLGLGLVYAAPPLLAVFAHGPARWLGLAAWIMMAIAYVPTLVFYRLSPLRAIALPLIALAYLFFTLDSAYQYGRGRGGTWKGRAQAQFPKQAKAGPSRAGRQ